MRKFTYKKIRNQVEKLIKKRSEVSMKLAR